MRHVIRLDYYTVYTVAIMRDAAGFVGSGTPLTYTFTKPPAIAGNWSLKKCNSH